MTSRRSFLTATGKGVVAASVVSGFPSIVPSTVFGQYAPSKRINVGMIGTGRISRVHDMPGVWKHAGARIMAVCDLDRHRVDEGKQLVNEHYAKATGKPYDGVTAYVDYREMLANKDIDAVVISTPDHQHAILGIDAAQAGKHIYLQKPTSLTIAEGRALSDAVHRTGVDLPDRQPAALDAAVPLRRGTRTQRPHRPVEDHRDRPAWRPLG